MLQAMSHPLLSGGCAQASARTESMKARIFSGSFLPGRAFHAGRHIDLPRAGQADRLGHVVGRQPAGQHPGHRPAPPAIRATSRRAARCRRAGRPPRAAWHPRGSGRPPWRRIDLGEVLAADAHRLHHRQAVAGLDLGDARGAFACRGAAACRAAPRLVSTSSVASSASTVSATGPPSGTEAAIAGRVRDRCRGDFGKNTKPR